jgi:hypothetical protein
MPTLTATSAMKARLATPVPTPSRPAVQHAADKSVKKPPIAQQKTATLQTSARSAGKTASDETAKSNTPLDPELAARRKERNEARNALFLKLREVSPVLFAAIPPPPMAIGIHDVIVERLGLDPEGKTDLRVVLGHHVHRIVYQKQLAAEGAVRLDVDGMPAGEVTPDQREHAIERLAQMKAKRT